jgi:hypothetical protein
MSRRRASFTQAQITRAVRGAIKGGLSVSGVKVDADGSIIVLSGPEAPPTEGPADPADFMERLAAARGWKK